MPTHAALLAQISQTPILPNSLALWGLGQMGLVIKGADGIIYLDPCLSDIIPERAFPPPLAPESITHADYVFCSHEHIDHLDPKTLTPLLNASPQAQVITSGWCVDILDEMGVAAERVIVPETLQPLQLGSLTVTAIPSAHLTLEHSAEKGHRWLGFLLQWNGVTLYFAGDTVIYDGYIETLQGLPRANIAMIPVNGRDWFRERDNLLGNLMPPEAAQLAKALAWELVLTGHNDLLPRNSLPQGEIAQGFADYAPRQAYKYLQPGEMLYFVKP